MMGSKGSGGGGNNGVPVVIPTGSRKIVQSLKEIVNSSEQEIYAALKECNMDPNEAVNRLLSQDPFHEVKSKREKKKEVKDTTESRPHGVVASIHGGRAGVDHHAGRGRANIPSSNVISDSSKPMLKKENGSYAILTSSSSASALSGPNIYRLVAYSDNFPSENKAPIRGENDLISSSVQPSPGFQHAWGGPLGHVSMADIVKMGKPQVKRSGAPTHLTHQPVAPGSNDDFQLHDQSSKLYKTEPLITGQHVPSNDDDWSLDEQHTPPPNEDEWPPFENSQDESGQHVISRLDGGHIPDDGVIESSTNHMGFASVSNRTVPENDDTDPSLYDNNVYENVNAFQPHMHAYEHNEDDYDNGVGAASTNLQHLSLQKNEQGSVPEDDGPAVVIPDHLQIHPSDCQHLSFGSFAASIGAFSGSAGSRSFKASLTETRPLPDTSSDSHPEIRNSEHYGDKHLRPTSNGDDTHGDVPNGGNYEAPSAPQTEVLQQHLGESAVGSQYPFPSAASSCSYETSQALDSTFTQAQVSSPMQNLAPFSNVLPSYTSSLPSNLLASAVQTGRETDLSYLPFPVTQPTATKYSNTASSLNSSLMLTPEGFRAGSVSATQQAPQSLPAASLATGLGLPQHLAMHAYSQPTLSLGPFANMVSYPFLPQSYSYVPSAFQQAFSSNNVYHQSLATVLPQYKNSLSASNLPQSGAVASGYGFNSSTNVPCDNFTLNPQTATTTLRYEDALRSQYKDAINLLSLQQNDNSGMWVPGAAARTAPNLPASTYYNFPGQSQQPGGLRQARQPSRHFSNLGYSNYYQSAGISLDHQQQLVRDSALGGSQGQQSKQAAQIWQNTY